MLNHNYGFDGNENYGKPGCIVFLVAMVFLITILSLLACKTNKPERTRAKYEHVK